MNLEHYQQMLGTDELNFGFGGRVIDENIRFYRGDSMRGTFHLGDRLLIEPVLFADIQLGDVIVYRGTNGQGNAEEVVHRVVAITEDGLITRGDNNRRHDFSPVQRDQIIGKVVEMENGGRKQAVVDGSKGLRRAKLRWAILRLDRVVRLLFQFPYHLLRNSQIVPKLWRPVITEIHLKTDCGPLVKYIYKQRTVAVWDASQKRFDCRKPFALVIPNPEEAK
jgi:signal peptidase I